MIHQFEVHGGIWIEDQAGEVRECIGAVTYTFTGAEVWLYVDKETRELLLAERIDGEWYDLDLDYAREEYADIIRCLKEWCQ